MALKIQCFSSPSCGNTPNRYEILWDEYSDTWDVDPYYRQYQYLGDEWGSDDWVRYNMNTFVIPYLDSTKDTLEIGPGGGRYTAEVIQNVRKIHLIDTSGKMLNRCKSRFSKFTHIDYVKGSGHDLASIASESVDVVFAFNVFVQLQFEDIVAYMMESKRVLRREGKLIFQYADLSSQDGWEYFQSKMKDWSLDPCQRSRFCELTLDLVFQLSKKIGFKIVKNKNAGRDAVVVLEKEPTRQEFFKQKSEAEYNVSLKRDYTYLDDYLSEIENDIYDEEPTAHHTAAAIDATHWTLSKIPFDTVLEIGCGSAPCLDELQVNGKKTCGISMGSENVSHPTLRKDMQFTGLVENQFDLVVMRHVLEHSPMPLLLLMEVHRISKRYALVIVPCDHSRWIAWRNHYSVFSKQLWEKLFERAGWTIVAEQDAKFDNDDNSYEWRYILEKTTNR